MKNETEKRQGDSVAKGATYLTLSVLIVKIIGFVYKLPISYLIGDEGMGYFNTAYTVFSFFYLICTGGVPKAVSLLVAGERAKGREERALCVLVRSARVFSLVGAALSFLLLLFGGTIAGLVGNGNATFSLLCIAPSLLFVASGGVLRGYLNGEMRLREIAVASLLEGVFKFILGLGFALLGVRLGFDIPLISGLTILGISVSSFISAAALYLFCRKSLRAGKKLKRIADFDGIMPSLLKIALPITLSCGLSGVSGMIDLSLIMRRLASLGIGELEASALYGNYTTLALPLISFAASMLVPISTACAPLVASSYAKGDYGAVRENVSKFFNAMLLFAVPLTLGFLFFAEEILTVLFEDNSALIATPLLQALSPSVLLLSALTLINTFLEALGRTKSALLSMCVGCLVKITLSYILIGKEEISILGAPISTTVSYAVSMILSALMLYFAVGGKLSVGSSCVRITLAALVSVGSARALYLAISPTDVSLGALLICVILCVVCYFALAFLLGAFDVETNDFMSNITKNRVNNWKKGRN